MNFYSTFLWWKTKSKNTTLVESNDFYVKHTCLYKSDFIFIQAKKVLKVRNGSNLNNCCEEENYYLLYIVCHELFIYSELIYFIKKKKFSYKMPAVHALSIYF